MKGDFSRQTGIKAARKHYSGVLKQQGRVQLDSDWNELISIIAHQRGLRTVDTIGYCGAPLHHDGFRILHRKGLDDLLISAGRMYVGGLLCETTPASKLPITGFTRQGIKVDDTSIDGVPLGKGQWVLIASEEQPEGVVCQIKKISGHSIELEQSLASLQGRRHAYLKRLLLYGQQADYPHAPAIQPLSGSHRPPADDVFVTPGAHEIRDRTDLVYLDVWERHITTLEDPELREVALGGPDTDTRIRTIAQVKILQDVGRVKCDGDIPAWNNLIARANGRLSARLKPADPPDSPCELGESGGYHGLENRLYRVEIHQGGTKDQATFKWSRGNAAQAYAIGEFISDADPAKVFKVRLKQTGRDHELKLKKRDWIEISGDTSDLADGHAGTMAQVENISPDGMILTLNTDVAKHRNESSPHVRRWDTGGQLTDNAVTAINISPEFKLEDGIEIEFTGDTFKSGDYWVFSARHLTGAIETLVEEPPMGIRHHYCKLAVVHWKEGGEPEIEDCRKIFSPLTELEVPATPGGRGGCCTVTVGKDGDFMDIQAAVDELKGGPGTVCIKPGVYTIDKPILIQRGRDITIKGCGGTPLIINAQKYPESRGVFAIKDSTQIDINHLWCVSISGTQSISVLGSGDFNISDCMIIAGGTQDGLLGAVSILGDTLNSGLHNNIILGAVGIQFIKDTHAAIKIENNTIFALTSAVIQGQGQNIHGMNIVDNLMAGISLSVLSKAAFPEPLFKAVEENNLFDQETMTGANSSRKEGVAFESVNAQNVSPILELHKLINAADGIIHTEKKEIKADDFPTTGALIDLAGNAREVSILANLLIGRSGVKCTGSFVDNLRLENNRIISLRNGIEFSENGSSAAQKIKNICFGQNRIFAQACGIQLNNSGINLEDFYITDNSIENCAAFGIQLNVLPDEQSSSESSAPYQRVIQRNSINVQGAGISLNASYSRILDNEINIGYSSKKGENNSRGIILKTGNCTISGNVILGAFKVDKKLYSYGGIYLELSREALSARYQHIYIHHNKILGGIHNGIELASHIKGLTVEENQIAGMGLNGIAVKKDVNAIDLCIKGNHISDCHQLLGKENWWVYAGIVLDKAKQVQISGNTISNLALKAQEVMNGGALYAEIVQEISLSDNQFLLEKNRNGFQGSQAVIHIYENNPAGNADIRITNNLVKGFKASALLLGNHTKRNDGSIEEVKDDKVIITGNHFESLPPKMPVVSLQCNHCIFSGNYVEGNLDQVAVDLGYGQYVNANGNIVIGKIEGKEPNPFVVNNIHS
jgi:hypothetical protein